MFRKLNPNSELGKQVSAFISKNKEEEKMTKKFTEEEYQKIVEIADKTMKGSYFGSIPVRNFWNELLDSTIGEKYYLSKYGKEIMAIANPITRNQAHEQFIEKEKEYIWKTKKKDSENDCLILYKIVDTGGILTDFKSKTTPDPITESEIREWGYNPDMFDKEEVEG